MLETGQCYNGFKLEKKEFIAEISTDVHFFRHINTRAQLLVLPNDDDNKVFMITFKTPPSDDTGVAHIIEHSVLNGSKKYPVKEPFSELLKGSLFTFLNAMTYPDRTVYPVASRNNKDFSNLMDVYLDAVFNPILSENTYLQEGWHYDIDNANSELAYSGVVYNEMLGSYSDPETILVDEMNKALFPDSIYGKSSGGDPEFITDLTYSQFQQFHDTYYHPANSRILLYGDITILDQLAHINSYLSTFDYQDIETSIPAQRRFINPVRWNANYPVTSSENKSNGTYALKSYLLDHPTDPEFYLAFSILSRILSGTSASKLRKELIESHLGESTIHYGYESELFDNYYCIGLKGTSDADVPKMCTLIDQTLERLVESGIDPLDVQASLNSVEFQLREANFGGYPKGLCYGLTMVNSWVYEADPLMHLKYESTLKIIRKKSQAGNYFESMIKEYLLNNQHQAVVTLSPDATMEDKRLSNLAGKLKKIKSCLSSFEFDKLIQKKQELYENQLKPDSPEAIATIPKLVLSDIEKTIEHYPFQLLKDDYPKRSFSLQNTNAIAYIIVSFDTAAIPQTLLPYLPLFCQLTMQTGTESKDYTKIIQEIDIDTGGIYSSHTISCINKNTEQINSRISYSGKCLSGKITRFFTILSEILKGCNLTDLNRIRELTKIALSSLKSQLIPNGHSFAAKRLNSYSSTLGYYQELSSGISQYMFLESLVKQLESDPDKVLSDFNTIKRLIFNQNNLHIHLTGGNRELTLFNGEVSSFISSLSADDYPKETCHAKPLNKNEGFIIPSRIQYVGKGMNFYSGGITHNGSFDVITTLLSKDYLWNKIRVQGGAYGCFASLDVLSGNFYCVSYRDPNLKETLNTFSEIGNYLASLKLDNDTFEKLIVGTIGSLDSPKTAEHKGAAAFSRYLNKISHDEIQTRRNEILASSKLDIKNYIKLFQEFSESAPVCVIGSKEKLNECQSLFSTISDLFN